MSKVSMNREGTAAGAPLYRGIRRQHLLQLIHISGSALIGAFAAFVMQVFLGRTLGASDYGALSSATVQAVVFSQFVGFGLQIFWVSSFGKEGWAALRWMPGSKSYIIFTTVITLSVYVAWSLLGPHSEKTKVLLLLMAPAMIGYASAELLAAKFQLEGRFGAVSLLQSLSHMLRLILIVPTIYLVSGAAAAILAACGYAIVGLIAMAVSLLQLKKMIGGELNLHGHGTRLAVGAEETTAVQVLRAAWPFGVDVAIYFLYFHCANVLLQYLTSTEKAGYYYAAFTILNCFYLIPFVIYTKYLLPKINRWMHSDRGRLLFVFKFGAAVMAILGVFACSLLWVFAEEVVFHIYGASFDGASSVLRFMSLCIPIRLMSTAIGSVLTSPGSISGRMHAKLLSGLVCVLSNLAFIPLWGVLGAVIATILTELMLLLSFSFCVYRGRLGIFKSGCADGAGI